MTKQERNALLIKMKKVIRSCNTMEQLTVAIRYAALVRRTLDKHGWILLHTHFYLDHVTEEVMYVTNKIMQAEK